MCGQAGGQAGAHVCVCVCVCVCVFVHGQTPKRQLMQSGLPAVLWCNYGGAIMAEGLGLCSYSQSCFVGCAKVCVCTKV